jgi:hypothetical protein
MKSVKFHSLEICIQHTLKAGRFNGPTQTLTLVVSGRLNTTGVGRVSILKTLRGGANLEIVRRSGMGIFGFSSRLTGEASAWRANGRRDVRYFMVAKKVT